MCSRARARARHVWPKRVKLYANTRVIINFDWKCRGLCVRASVCSHYRRCRCRRQVLREKAETVMRVRCSYYRTNIWRTQNCILSKKMRGHENRPVAGGTLKLGSIAKRRQTGVRTTSFEFARSREGEREKEVCAHITYTCL